jgi:GntR family transcriptional repressor for pyruvate dehydrogenase complex
VIAKAKRLTLTEQVMAGVVELIDTQRLKDGDLLPPEATLAAEFGVSRPIVREGLKALMGMGIIEVVNGRGTRVKPLTSEPLRVFFERALFHDEQAVIELMEIRRGIEVQAAGLAAERRTKGDLRDLNEIVKEMRAHLREFDTYNSLDLRFHLRIAQAAHNGLIYHLMESIRHVLHRSIEEGFRRRQRNDLREKGQATHEVLVKELELGDREGARRAMEIHFDEAVRGLELAQADLKKRARSAR